MKPLMSLDEAWARLHQALRQHAHVPHKERLPTEDVLGRVLAEDVVSDVTVPPNDNSAMDGYAVRTADVASPGVSLPLSQRIAAGQTGSPLLPGTCARIFTGAPVPEGADAVVMQEHTEPGDVEGSARFTHAVSAGQNIRRAGEDIAHGQTVLSAGRRLGPAALGVAASVGRADLAVFARPRVAVLTTGDELIMPGLPLPPGAIYNSNRHTLMGLVQAAGAAARSLGTVPDQLGATRAALRAAAEQHDLVISSGGVSVGEEDHLRQAVQAEGGLDFWALAIKPGKPFVFGWLGRADGSKALYMGLPGNPVASWLTFLLLVRPVIGMLAGEGWHLPHAISVPAAFAWPKPDKRREFLRVRLNESGHAELFPNQGSGVLTSASWADGVVDVPPQTVVQPGDLVRWLPSAELMHPSVAERQP